MTVEQNEKMNTPILLGLIALACWLGCPVAALLGLSPAVFGLLLPGALACGLFGVITSLPRIGKDDTILVVAALVLNGLTPFVMVGHLIWFASRLEM